VVASPTCARQNKRRQPETPAQSNSPIKSKHLKASLVHSRSIPSTTTRRCSTPHMNDAAHHASRNNDPSPAPPAINLSQTQPPISQLHHKNADRPQNHSLASIKHANKPQLLLTQPKAIIATPLLKPATDTGVFLCVVVPSPTCASQIKRRQPETRLPRHKATAPS
jgi:hypothetical protein